MLSVEDVNQTRSLLIPFFYAFEKLTQDSPELLIDFFKMKTGDLEAMFSSMLDHGFGSAMKHSIAREVAEWQFDDRKLGLNDDQQDALAELTLSTLNETDKLKSAKTAQLLGYSFIFQSAELLIDSMEYDKERYEGARGKIVELEKKVIEEQEVDPPSELGVDYRKLRLYSTEGEVVIRDSFTANYYRDALETIEETKDLVACPKEMQDRLVALRDRVQPIFEKLRANFIAKNYLPSASKL